MQIIVKKQKPKQPGGRKKMSKDNKIITALIVGIAVVSIIIAIMVGNHVGKANQDDLTTEITTEQDVTFENDPILPEDITEESTTEEKTTKADVEMVVLDEPAKPTIAVTEPTQQTKPDTTKKPETTTKPSTTRPVTSAKPTETPVLGNDDVKEYSCGTKGHHCDSKETHNFIVGLENKGCPHCGSHSCKSFYTYDEWGNACYDPTRCPEYNVKADPTEYCQECGKECGDGGKGTCVRFTVDTKCPSCKKSVKAKTCHSH